MPAHRTSEYLRLCSPDRRSGAVVHWLEEPAVLRQVRVGACGEVETAGPSLSALHLRDAHVDPSSARVRVLRGVDPTHPFPTRHRGDLVPQVLDLLRGSCQSCRKILGHARLWPIPGHLDVERRSVTRADASSVLQRVVDPHPVTKISVWFEHRGNSTPLIVPWTATCPREGRFLPAVSGSRNTADVRIVASVASKRMATPCVR